jgi:hypothetical protein
MARIVGAFGVSHGPLLATPPDQWHRAPRSTVEIRATRIAATTTISPR